MIARRHRRSTVHLLSFDSALRSRSVCQSHWFGVVNQLASSPVLAVGYRFTRQVLATARPALMRDRSPPASAT